MTAVAEAMEPGQYDIPAELYHQDPVPGGSLSATGAKKILDCPARFKHALDNPEPPKRVFELGTAAHSIVLGDGPELAKIEHKDWRTKAAAADVKAARDAGKIPLKPAEYQAVFDMATALDAHPEASELLAPGSGEAEQSLFWQGEGIWWRARLDWLRGDGIVDYKSAKSVKPESLEKAIWEYGYHVQEHVYRTGAAALGILPPAAPFRFIFQEREAPYLITVAELDPAAQEIARRDVATAAFLYDRGRRTGEWPAYVPQTAVLTLPEWVQRQYR
ncbi:PD-(D/E)XK nuclease-like domain-containing protein [Streptomyces phytophilus]|uniref:PD-(D/E)XK nuclease-like domain-containing protein n=1 Tax=Streptomyces phytophilus TaxID=722715 RepID=UPI002867ED23|nr:PD-(D/E)XK nuclease-like domain-containing protein [Streptomyces phytophilus]